MRQSRAVLRLVPEFLPARVLLADLLAERGEFEAAIVEYRELLARTPEYGHAYLGLGTALGRLNRHDEAIEALQAAAERDPYNAVIHYNLAGSYVASGQLQDALVSYRRAVNLKSDDPDFVANLGAILGDLRHWEEAVIVLQRALALDSNTASSRNLGVALYELHRYSEAEGAFRMALRLEDSSPFEARSAETTVRLALAIREQGRVDEAIALLEQLRKREAENSLVLTVLADTYFIADRIDNAMRIARLAVERYPDLSDSHSALGWALTKAHSPAEARECFERALQLAPESIDPVAGLGVVLSVLGKHRAAFAQFDEVDRRDPEYFAHRQDLAKYVTNSRLAIGRQPQEDG